MTNYIELKIDSFGNGHTQTSGRSSFSDAAMAVPQHPFKPLMRGNNCSSIGQKSPGHVT